jgi:hypothetical protein
MYEPRGDRPADYGRSPNLVDTTITTNLPRSGMVPSWITRISWGSVFAAAFVVVAIQFALAGLSIWGNFGLGSLTTPGTVVTSATAIAVWTGVWAAVALAIGGLVSGALSNSRSVSDGLWHAFVTWGVSVTATTVLSAVGIAGLLGFGLNSGAAVKNAIGLPSASVSPLTSVSSATGTYAGYYLLFSVIGLVTALAGGYVAATAMRRRAVVGVPSSMSTSQGAEERRAA